MTNLSGQSLGRYQIVKKIGEGGMATVFQAYDSRLERHVAVKVIRADKLSLSSAATSLKRFEREAKALAKLTHPNIVPITDYGEFNGRPFLVMPFIPGGTLKQALTKPIPWKDATRFLLPVARALQFAHLQNIVHRDVKPSNILVTPSGEPMLTDFGIAKILMDTGETAELTHSGVGIGTPEYMSPEQSQGKQVDARTDIYALGVVFYEMVTGRKPYIADTPAAILLKQMTDPLPRPTSFVRDLPERVEKVLIKALAKFPENRFQDMGEFVNALTALLEGRQPDATPLSALSETALASSLTPAGQPTLTESTLQPPRPSAPAWIPWAVGALGLCVMGLIAIAIIFWVTFDNPPSTPDPATLPPAFTSTSIEPSPRPTDTLPPPTEAPTFLPSPVPTLVPTDIPTRAPTITPTSTPTCNPLYPSDPKLQFNHNVFVCTKSDRLKIRTDASMNAPEKFRIRKNTPFQTKEGPICVPAESDDSHDYWWWEVIIPKGTSYDVFNNDAFIYSDVTDRDIIGWAREGWDEIDIHFFCPYP